MLDEIITSVLKAEGWDHYTDHPADKGGPTKWGITLGAWQKAMGDSTLTGADVRKITEEQARQFYLDKYILGPGFDKLSPILIPLMVDCGVNHGPERAIRWLQKAAGAEQDGKLGPKTLAAVGSFPVTYIYLQVCAARFRFYGAIVSRDHSQAVFASGWNNRGAKFLVALADLLKDS